MSRELDVLIAEVVFGAKVQFLDQKFGWRIDYVTDKDECNVGIPTDFGYDGYQLKYYSKHMNEAWEIVEHLRTNCLVFSLVTLYNSQTDSLQWIAKWECVDNGGYDFYFDYADTAPEAICLATLKLLEDQPIE